jgi:hypothetical protein
MGATTDQASTMVKALGDFEGAPCVDHKIQNALKHASKGDFIQNVEKKCRGIVAHFRRSSKVTFFVHNITGFNLIMYIMYLMIIY